MVKLRQNRAVWRHIGDMQGMGMMGHLEQRDGQVMVMSGVCENAAYGTILTKTDEISW